MMRYAFCKWMNRETCFSSHIDSLIMKEIIELPLIFLKFQLFKERFLLSEAQKLYSSEIFF